jgi:hypothetical protein
MISKITIILFALFLNIKIIAPFLNIKGGVMYFWLSLSLMSTILLVKRNKKTYLTSKRIPFILLFLLLITLAIYSLLWTRAPNYGTEKIFVFVVKLILTIPLAILVTSHKNLFFKSLIIFTLPIILYVLIEFGDPLKLFQSFGTHDRLGRDGPIAVGRYFGMISIIYFIISIYQKNKLIKYFSILVFLISFSFTVLSGSKGPLLAFFITAFYYYLLHIKKTNSLKKIVLKGLIILIILLPIIQLNFQLGDFVEARYSGNTSSYSSRVDLINIALEGYLDSNIFILIFGNGARF